MALLPVADAAPQAPRAFWPMAALLVVGALLIGVEFAAQQDRLLRCRAATGLPIALPLLFVALGAAAACSSFARALQRRRGRAAHARSARARGHRRDREATSRSSPRLRVEQVTEKERKRIAADLHDDLGAKLLTIVHTSDRRAHLDAGARGARGDAAVGARPDRQAGAAGRRARRLARRDGVAAGAGRHREPTGARPIDEMRAAAAGARLRADHAHPARGGQQHHQAQRRVALHRAFHDRRTATCSW